MLRLTKLLLKAVLFLFYGKSGIFEFIRAPLSMGVISTHESLNVPPFVAGPLCPFGRPGYWQGVKMKKRGFTLIELLVVIAIIALLMGILMPSLNSAREQARKVRCGANLKQIGVGLALYADAEDGNLPENEDPDHPYTAYRASYDRALKLGLLYSSGIIKNPRIFYCPSSKIDWLKFKNYNDPAPWGTLPQNYNTEMGLNQWVRTGYSYYPQSRELDENGFPKVASKYNDLNPNRTAVTDAIWQKSKLSHVSGSRPTGLNALFGDGHVYFTVTEAAFTDELWGTADAEVRPGTKEFQTILDLLRP